MMNRWIACLLILALSVFAACGDEDSPSESNNDNNSNNASNQNNTNNTTQSNNFDNRDTEYQASYQLRFDSLAFDDGTAGKPVNGLLAQNFNQDLEFPIVVLVDIKEIDPDAGTFELRGGSGLKTDTAGEYEWDPGQADTYFPGTLTAATGEFLGQLDSLDFVATLPTETDVQKVTIPIQQLEFEGNLVLSDDGSSATIPNGRLAGFLTREDGDQTEIRLSPTATPITATDLFGPENLNYDSQGAEIVELGEGDSWYLTADFSAVPTEIVE